MAQNKVIGHATIDTKLMAGYTHIQLTGPDGGDTSEWIPRDTFKLRADSRIPGLPALQLGLGARRQSDVSKIGGARQDAYMIADDFESYDLTDKATLRFNAKNLTDKKYPSTVAYGAIYGAPRNYSVSLEYKL